MVVREAPGAPASRLSAVCHIRKVHLADLGHEHAEAGKRRIQYTSNSTCLVDRARLQKPAGMCTNNFVPSQSQSGPDRGENHGPD